MAKENTQKNFQWLNNNNKTEKSKVSSSLQHQLQQRYQYHRPCHDQQQHQRGNTNMNSTVTLQNHIVKTRKYWPYTIR